MKPLWMVTGAVMASTLFACFANAASNDTQNAQARQELEQKKEDITHAGDYIQTNQHQTQERKLLSSKIKTDDAVALPETDNNQQ